MVAIDTIVTGITTTDFSRLSYKTATGRLARPTEIGVYEANEPVELDEDVQALSIVINPVVTGRTEPFLIKNIQV